MDYRVKLLELVNDLNKMSMDKLCFFGKEEDGEFELTILDNKMLLYYNEKDFKHPFFIANKEKKLRRLFL